MLQIFLKTREPMWRPIIHLANIVFKKEMYCVEFVFFGESLYFLLMRHLAFKGWQNMCSTMNWLTTNVKWNFILHAIVMSHSIFYLPPSPLLQDITSAAVKHINFIWPITFSSNAFYGQIHYCSAILKTTITH